MWVAKLPSGFTLTHLLSVLHSDSRLAPAFLKKTIKPATSTSVEAASQNRGSTSWATDFQGLLPLFLSQLELKLELEKVAKSSKGFSVRDADHMCWMVNSS